MSNENIDWLLKDFPKFKGLVPKGDVWNAYLEAERILLDRPNILQRGCNCVRNNVKQHVDALYENWLLKYEESKKVE
jgi:hypothetical protein